MSLFSNPYTENSTTLHEAEMGTLGLKSNIVLAVEDELTDQLLIKRAIESLGQDIQFVLVDCGSDALDYVFRRGAYQSRDRDTDPRLVLLDHSLPDMTGLEVLKSIRDNPDSHRLEVAVFSARYLEEERRQYDLYRIVDFVQKPVDPVEFVEKVSALTQEYIYVKK